MKAEEKLSVINEIAREIEEYDGEDFLCKQMDEALTQIIDIIRDNRNIDRCKMALIKLLDEHDCRIEMRDHLCVVDNNTKEKEIL